MQFLEFTQSKGSSANLPAHWAGGARARNLTAHFAEQNTNPVGAKNEGAAEMPSQNAWAALRAANEKVGQFSESQILVQLYNQIRTYFERDG